MSENYPHHSFEEDDLTYMAAGGEHVVFESKDIDWQQHVIKINYLSAKEALDINAQKNEPLEAIDPEWKRKYEQDAARRDNEYKELSSYFEDHVPEQEVNIAMVPVTNEHIRLLYGPGIEPPAGFTDVKELPAVITFQDKLDTKNLVYQYYLQFGDSAHNESSKEELDHIKNNFFFEGENDYTNEVIQTYPSLIKVRDLIMGDEAWGNAFRDFTERLIDYTEKTAKAIDVVGKDNILFYHKEDGTFDYKLLDALLADPKNFITEYQLFQKWRQGLDPNSNINEVIPDNIHYLRGINALACITGSDKRLRSLKGEAMIKQVESVIDYLQSEK